MKQLRGFGDVLLASLISLLACTFVWYVGLVVLGAASTWPRPDWPLLLVLTGVVVFYGFLVALPVLVVFAAPAYVLLLRAGRASYATAAAIGVAPGVAMLCFSARAGVASVATGVAVALATHRSCKARLNDSLKPTLLRGAA